MGHAGRAQHVHDRQYPIFVRGLDYGDVVHATPQQGRLIADRIIQRSGHSTYRVVVNDLREGTRHGDYHALLAALREHGAAIEYANQQFFAVDVPPHAIGGAVYDVLNAGREFGVWDFESGSSGPSTGDLPWSPAEQ